MLALFQPVMLEEAAEERVQTLCSVVLHRFQVVLLGEPLDVQRGQEHSQRGVGQDSRGDLSRRTDHSAPSVELGFELLDEPPEELDVLRFLLGEAKKSSSLLTLVSPTANVVEHRRDDVLLDQSEQGEVGESADVIELQLFLGVEASDRADARQ